MQTNRVCKTCGKEYYYCPNCNKSQSSPQWMTLWHDENCKKVFEIVSEYAQNRISKDVAKSRLEKCNLRLLYTFTEKIRNFIDEIMKEDDIPKVENTEPKRVAQRRTTRTTRQKKD